MTICLYDDGISPAEKSALASRSFGVAEQRVNPPELSPAKRELQEQMEQLDEARSKLLGAHEILSAYGRDEAEQVLAVIDSLSWAINELEDQVNEP